MTNVKNFDELISKRSSLSSSMEEKTPGMILQGVALNLSRYNNRQVRTRFQHYIDTSDCMMWVFNDVLLSRAGIRPKEVYDESWRENSFKNVYSKIADQVLTRNDIEHDDGLVEILDNLDKEMSENQTDLVHPRLKLYDENERIIFSTGRRKSPEKYSTKVAASLAFAKAYADIRNKELSKTQIKKIRPLLKEIDFIHNRGIEKDPESKHIEKSRVRDFVGLRVGFKDYESALAYFKRYNSWIREGFKVQLEPHHRAKGPRFWEEQIEKDFEHFYQHNTQNGFQNYQLDIRSQFFKSTVIDFHGAPFDWILNNEGNPKTVHRNYKGGIIESVENLPKDYYQSFLNYKDRVLEFTSMNPYGCNF
ncbi:hypothetical protein C0585_05335 [Candidatus Woesearchaeota archaeon]|nr:MAG: hypothetical protein C0585_05335 [Candidatus Woesearchaeota archaeon]